jgi:hypothetical protein
MRCCSYNYGLIVLVMFGNFQTSLVLLIPNCTRHRMITYTNYDNDRNYIDNYMSNHSYDNYIHLLVHSYEKML